MKKTILFLATAFLLIFTSCSKSAEQTIDTFGVTFTCPAGWVLDETEDYGSAYYICVEKEGLNSNGIVTMVFTDVEYSLEEYLEVFSSELEDQGFDGLRFEGPFNSSYGEYPGIEMKYAGNFMSLAHQGRINVFNAGGRIYCITHQEAVEDAKKNKEGFKTIEESFRVK